MMYIQHAHTVYRSSSAWTSNHFLLILLFFSKIYPIIDILVDLLSLHKHAGRRKRTPHGVWAVTVWCPGQHLDSRRLEAFRSKIYFVLIVNLTWTEKEDRAGSAENHQRPALEKPMYNHEWQYIVPDSMKFLLDIVDRLPHTENTWRSIVRAVSFFLERY